MKQSEINKIKEFYLTGGTEKSWAKLYATTDNSIIQKIAKIGAELYSYSYPPYYSGRHIQIADLPEFWNNATLNNAKQAFTQQYLKPIVDDEIERIEKETLDELKLKYE